MKITIQDRQNESNSINGTTISSKTALLEVLEELVNGTPFFCELEGDNGCNLLVGIGKPFGCVQFSHQDGNAPYLMAMSGEAKVNVEHIDFLIGGTATPVPSQYCIPFMLVKQVAAHFQETGGRDTSVEWDEI